MFMFLVGTFCFDPLPPVDRLPIRRYDARIQWPAELDFCRQAFPNRFTRQVRLPCV